MTQSCGAWPLRAKRGVVRPAGLEPATSWFVAAKATLLQNTKKNQESARFARGNTRSQWVGRSIPHDAFAVGVGSDDERLAATYMVPRWTRKTARRDGETIRIRPMLARGGACGCRVPFRS